LLLYLVFCTPCGIFEFRSCISVLFFKKGGLNCRLRLNFRLTPTIEYKSFKREQG